MLETRPEWTFVMALKEGEAFDVVLREVQVGQGLEATELDELGVAIRQDIVRLAKLIV